jgi:hypothetical protein
VTAAPATSCAAGCSRGRQLSGDEAEWVALDVIREAVDVLLEINDDPTHLFGYRLWPTSPPRLSKKISERLAGFQDHLNDLFCTPEALFDGDQPWGLHHPPVSPHAGLAHRAQPFGVVPEPGSTTTQSRPCSTTSKTTTETGTTAPAPAAARRIDDEFERIRRELGDLPSVVSDESRLRTMLAHDPAG